MRQKTVITKLLQRVTDVYYKVSQVLQSATVITKWGVTQTSPLWRRVIGFGNKYCNIKCFYWFYFIK